MAVQRGCLPDEPVMVAWETYKKTDDFANTKKWASAIDWIKDNPDHIDGQLWAAFVAGWQAAGGKIEP